MLRPILFKGQSQYGTLKFFTEQLHHSFKGMGFNSAMIDLTSPKWMSQLQDELNIGGSFFCSLNGIGSDLRINGESLPNILGIPFISIYVDHPYHHMQRLSQPIKKHIVTVVDKKHHAFLQEYFKPDHFAVSAFLPHGGIQNDQLVFSQEQFVGRSNTILFTGSYKGAPEQSWKSLDNPFYADLIDEVFLARSGVMTIEDAFEYVLAHRNLHLSSDIRKKLKLLCVHSIDKYATSSNRHRLLQELIEHNFNVDIYGNRDWVDFVHKCKNVNYKGNVQMKDLIDLYCSYKITVNDNNNFNHGSHERVFNSIANGCYCVTAESSYYQEELNGIGAVLQYSRADYGTLAEKINSILQDNDYAYSVIEKSRQRVIDHHLWSHRAQTILDLYSFSLS